MRSSIFIWKKDGVEERGIFAGVFEGQAHYVTVVEERTIVVRSADEVTEVRAAIVIDVWDSKMIVEKIEPSILNVLMSCGCATGSGVKVTCVAHGEAVSAPARKRDCNCSGA